MAKKQRTYKTWHKKHIPTRWGIAVLSFLLLATVILIPVLSQQQVSESNAASVATSKQCISYNTSGKCLLYQTTTTTVNTKSPCVGYNTSGKCVQYANTTQNTTTFVPTTIPNKKTTPKSTGPVVVNKSGPGILVCNNGKAVEVGGGAYNESRSELAHICSINKNNVFVQGGKYNCTTVPASYKYLCKGL